MAYLDVIARPTLYPPTVVASHEKQLGVTIGVVGGVSLLFGVGVTVVLWRTRRARPKKIIPWVKNLLYGPSPIVVNVDTLWELNREKYG